MGWEGMCSGRVLGLTKEMAWTWRCVAGAGWIWEEKGLAEGYWAGEGNKVFREREVFGGRQKGSGEMGWG